MKKYDWGKINKENTHCYIILDNNRKNKGYITHFPDVEREWYLEPYNSHFSLQQLRDIADFMEAL